MMNYEVEYQGETFELPAYNFKIAEKLEVQEKVNAGNDTIKNKCRKMYNLISELIGSDNVKQALGEFEDTDPNAINLLYLNIVRTYNKPLQEYNTEQIEDAQLDKLLQLINALDTASRLKVLK